MWCNKRVEWNLLSSTAFGQQVSYLSTVHPPMGPSEHHVYLSEGMKRTVSETECE
jgi:hypothetical protein